jgi:hypothetical protein
MKQEQRGLAEREQEGGGGLLIEWLELEIQRFDNIVFSSVC